MSNALHVFVEGYDHPQKFLWAADSLQQSEEAFSADQVKGLGQIKKRDEKWLSFLSALFLQLAK